MACVQVDGSFIAIPILLTMGVSIGNAIHLNQFFLMRISASRIHAAYFAIYQAWRPIFYSAFTTMAALLTFVFIRVHTIRQVGIASASSILVLFLLCILVFPIIISFGTTKQIINFRSNHHLLNSISELIFRWMVHYRNFILIFFCLLTLIAFYGSSKIKVDFNISKMMGDKLHFMKDQIHIKNSQICSNEFINLSIVGEKDWFRDPENIQRLKNLEKDIQHLPLINRATSINLLLDYSHHMHLGKCNKDVSKTASKQELFRNYYLLRRYAPDRIKHWINDDYSAVRVFIEMSDFSSKTIQDNVVEIEALCDEYFPAKRRVFLSGTSLQMAQMNQYLTKGLIQSIGMALLMILCFKSIKLGLIAMVPNVFPVLICGALVGYSNIPLEFITMTAAPLILGLAVDDTIHFMSSLRDNVIRFGDAQIGVKSAYREVGIAISKTTLILATCFLIFTVSDVNSTTNMGILSSVGIITAYLADVILVPLLILWTNPFKLSTRNKKKVPIK